MIVERFNEAGALAALDQPFISTRLCVSVQPETEILRFIKDSSEVTVNGLLFEPVPYAEFSPIFSGDGATADTTTITLDGRNMVVAGDETPDTILQRVLARPLRDRPIQIGLIVLNTNTFEPIGLIPQFVGIIDNAPFSRRKDERSADARIEINLASFRVFAQRRIARTYSDTDHTLRFPGDRAARWISDTVFRLGRYAWNKEGAQSSGITSGGANPGHNPFNNNVRTQLF